MSQQKFVEDASFVKILSKIKTLLLEEKWYTLLWLGFPRKLVWFSVDM